MTVWAISHDAFTVEHSDSSLSSDHMPHYQDGNRSTPVAIPTPIRPTCVDLDVALDNTGDAEGDFCHEYVGNENWCGGWDASPNWEAFRDCCTCCTNEKCGGNWSDEITLDDLVKIDLFGEAKVTAEYEQAINNNHSP